MPIYPNCWALAYMTVTDGETIALVPAWNFYRSYSSGGTEYDAVSYTHLDVYKRQMLEGDI